jgi:AcrR family transcriptional regulator
MKLEKPNRKKEQGAETKKRLYESAEKLFNQYSYNDVSIESIAAAASVTKGTFYVHFNSKDELYATLFSNYVSQIDMDYKKFIDDLPSDMPTSDVLLALIEKISDVLINTIGYDYLKTVYILMLTRSVNLDSIIGYNRTLYKIFHNILDLGIQRGEFKPSFPPEALTRHFVIAIRGLANEWCIRYPDYDLKEQALLHFRLLLNGIMVNPSEIPSL